MNPKIQIALCCLILLAVPGGIYSVREALRAGRTSPFIKASGRMITYARESRPRDFWTSIGVTIFAMVVGVFLAITGLVDAFKRLDRMKATTARNTERSEAGRIAAANIYE